MDESEQTEDEKKSEKTPEEGAGADEENGEKKTPRPSSSEARGARFKDEIVRMRQELTASREANSKLADIIKQTTQKPDPTDDKPKAHRARLDRALSNIQANPDAGTTEFYDALEEMISYRADEKARERAEEVVKSLPKQAAAHEQALLAEYPWLTDPQINRIAEGNLAFLARKENRDLGDHQVMVATMREAAALTAQQLGLGGSKETPDRDKQAQRLSGMRGNDSGAGNPNGLPPMNESLQRMAEATFPQDEPSAAHAKWWKTIGSKIQPRQ